MSGPLSFESFAELRRVAKKFGYHPNRDDTLSLVATLDKVWDQLADAEMDAEGWEREARKWRDVASRTLADNTELIDRIAELEEASRADR